MAFRLPEALAALAAFVPNPLVQRALGVTVGEAVPSPPPLPQMQLGRHATASLPATLRARELERLPSQLVGSLDFGRTLQTAAAAPEKKLERLAEKQTQELVRLNQDGVKIRNPEALQAAFG